ncbi:uncharacterized protein LOC125243888 [Megalobrama amblycephala]|uniref:uncharacterized protein LOC125243888 n=1 Tax=Megalobrama amblycephala TaxID=75352 RepID=UPI0020142E90|nr:uncharacterized protein LOC125243888 [Megalobrama amblycephala]
MQSSSSPSTFAEVIASLAVLHQEQHQALLDLRTDQERRFQAIVQAQQEDRERFRSWIDREVRQETIGQPAAPTHLPLNKMGPCDDPEAFLDLFERSAEASGWPRDQWSMRRRTTWWRAKGSANPYHLPLSLLLLISPLSLNLSLYPGLVRPARHVFRPGGGVELNRARIMDREPRPGGWDSLPPGRTPLLLLPSLRVNHLTRSLPQERRAGLGRPVGVAGTRSTLWTGVQ